MRYRVYKYTLYLSLKNKDTIIPFDQRYNIQFQKRKYARPAILTDPIVSLLKIRSYLVYSRLFLARAEFPISTVQFLPRQLRHIFAPAHNSNFMKSISVFPRFKTCYLNCVHCVQRCKMQQRVKFINERRGRSGRNFNKLSRRTALNFETGSNLYSKAECGKQGAGAAL